MMEGEEPCEEVAGGRGRYLGTACGLPAAGLTPLLSAPAGNTAVEGVSRI